MGLFQNNFQMALSNDSTMGQVHNMVNYCEQPRNFDAFVSADTGIRIRTRPGRNEQPNMDTMVQSQGIAPRRIRLGVVRRPLGSQDGSCACAPEDHNSKTIITAVRSLLIQLVYLTYTCHCMCAETFVFLFLQEKKASESENHAADGSSTVSDMSSTVTDDVDEPEEASPESTDLRNISEKHVATAESVAGSKVLLVNRRVHYTSKVSSNRATWSNVLAVSAAVLVSAILLVNIWAYVRS